MKKVNGLVKEISKGFIAGALATSLVFSPECIGETQNSIPEEIPKYKLQNNRCAAYVRKAAEDLFKKKYSPADAWNMRYVNRVTGQMEGLTNLEDLEKLQKLTPGSIVGLMNPQSKYKNRADSQGNPVKYTHVVLYLGEQGGKHYIAHQFDDEIEKTTLEDLVKRGLTPVEILNTKD